LTSLWNRTRGSKEWDNPFYIKAVHQSLLSISYGTKAMMGPQEKKSRKISNLEKHRTSERVQACMPDYGTSTYRSVLRT
jgi:hypothetical protein